MASNVLVLFITFAALLSAQTRNLDIYWMDVEGGGSTLIVTPEGQSLLVDTGNATPDDRDAKRIIAAAKAAGLAGIDYVLTTHFHGDHVGAISPVSKLIPIGQYLDHGDSVEADSPRSGPAWQAYVEVTKGKRTTMKVGDRLPLRGVDGVVVSSNGKVLDKAINGGGPNPFCQGAAKKDPDATENQRSLGFLLTYGRFKFLDLGDLTWDKEMELACPANKLGQVTLFQATHHGFVRDFSGAPAHVLALKPQVVVVNNGPRKGWHPAAWETAQRIEGLEGIWQIHLSLDSTATQNTAADMVANTEETVDCDGHWIKASVAGDGTFTLTNGRNSFSKTYRAR